GIVDESSWDEETAESGQTADGRININTATEAELCNIPGIGGTRAAAIVAYRESHGSFQKPEDIMKVSGIKEGLYGKIKDSIRVN
ncbi:MAG: helix-hairpin-helix domain-containing protein, partial [Lachnospiraceae bacterium]|nr:helix-hairpin-helix domain-containing protein [Lachnospiraceae bacterium]